MHRFPFLSTLITLIICLWFLGCQHNEMQATAIKPNILLIVADDLGWTDVGFQGTDFYETPVLDKLAKKGTIFTNAYANAANCAPSRACLITGLYPPRHGIYTVGNPDRGQAIHRQIIPSPNKTVLDTSLTTLPQVLKLNGYRTCVAGKWHLSDDPIPYGFDVNFGGFQAGHPKSYFSPYKNPNLTDGPDGEHLPARLAQEVMQWIDQPSSKPFFAYLPFYSVHTPIQGRPDLVEKYQQKEPGKQHHHAPYAAMVEAMDEAIGAIYDHLQSIGKANNTIILFTSDNGPHGVVSTAKPLRGVKGMFYEGGIRVPLFIVHPKINQSIKVNHTPVIGLDLFPTILSMVGIESKEWGLDGLDISALLEGGSLPERPLYWHFPAYLQMNAKNRALQEAHRPPHWRATPCSAIRYGKWKLVEYFEDRSVELFDLTVDLKEQQPIGQQFPEIQQSLHQQLQQWQQQTKALVPHRPNPLFKSSN